MTGSAATRSRLYFSIEHACYIELDVTPAASDSPRYTIKKRAGACPQTAAWGSGRAAGASVSVSAGRGSHVPPRGQQGRGTAPTGPRRRAHLPHALAHAQLQPFPKAGAPGGFRSRPRLGDNTPEMEDVGPPARVCRGQPTRLRAWCSTRKRHAMSNGGVSPTRV